MMKTKGYFRNSQKNDLFWEGKFCSTLPLVVFLFGFDLKLLWFNNTDVGLVGVTPKVS